MLFGLAALFIITAVGGTIFAAKSYLDGLNEKITVQQEQIAGLEVDKKLLEASNESLELVIEQRAAELDSINEELELFRKQDNESQARLNELESLLADQKRAKQIERIRNSRKATALLNAVNRQTKCVLENFHRFDGKCISGTFVLEGERLVPLEEETESD